MEELPCPALPAQSVLQSRALLSQGSAAAGPAGTLGSVFVLLAECQARPLQVNLHGAALESPSCFIKGTGSQGWYLPWPFGNCVSESSELELS